MTNDYELVDEITNQIKSLTKEQLEHIMEIADKELKYKNNEELIKSVNLIKEYCSKSRCDDCIFVTSHESCSLIDNNPNHWEV